MADKLRGNIDADEYKHVVLGLIFLKYISDAFEEKRTALLAGPAAGHDGGRIVFEGTPADLVAARSTLTGEHLAAYVGS